MNQTILTFLRPSSWLQQQAQQQHSQLTIPSQHNRPNKKKIRVKYAVHRKKLSEQKRSSQISLNVKHVRQQEQQQGSSSYPLPKLLCDVHSQCVLSRTDGCFVAMNSFISIPSIFKYEIELLELAKLLHWYCLHLYSQIYVLSWLNKKKWEKKILIHSIVLFKLTQQLFKYENNMRKLCIEKKYINSYLQVMYN